MFDVIRKSFYIPACYFRIRINFFHIIYECLLNLTKHVLIISKMLFKYHTKLQEILNSFCVLFWYLFILTTKNWRNSIVYEWHYRLSQVAFALNIFIRKRFLIFNYTNPEVVSVSVLTYLTSSFNHWGWINACSNLWRLV